MNMSKFRKVSSDKESSTFKHEDGHEMRVLHKVLSPKMRADIAAMPIHKDVAEKPATKGSPMAPRIKMAQGGSAYVDIVDSEYAPSKKADSPEHSGEGYTSKPLHSEPPENANDSKYKSQVEAFNAKMNVPVHAKGGEVKKYAEGGSTSAQDSPDQIAQDASAAQGPVHITINSGPQPAAQSAPAPQQAGVGLPPGVSIADLYGVPTSGGMGVVSPASAVSPGPEGATAVIPGTDNPNFQGAAPEKEPPAQISQPTLSQAAEAPAEPAQVPGYISQGLQSQLQGLQTQYGAEKQAAEGKAAALEQAQQTQNLDTSAFDNHINGLMQERQAVLEDLKNSKIDPKHFWNSKDTMGKIGTVLGLMIGGIGGPNNDVSRFIDQQISQDIDAQKANLDNKRSVLGALRDQFQDIKSASDFHRVILNDQVAHAIDLASAKASSPAALAALQMKKGQLLRESGVLMAQIGAQQTLNTPGVSPGAAEKALNTLRMMDPAKAKEAQERYVPGVGVASVPVSEATRNTLVARKLLNDNLGKLIELSNKFGGSLQGITDPRIRSEAEALTRQVQDGYRRANEQGVFKESEAKFVNGVIGDSPTSLFAKFTKVPGYKNAREINQANLNALYNQVGLKPTPAQQGNVRFTTGK